MAPQITPCRKDKEEGDTTRVFASLFAAQHFDRRPRAEWEMYAQGKLFCPSAAYDNFCLEKTVGVRTVQEVAGTWV